MDVTDETAGSYLFRSTWALTEFMNHLHISEFKTRQAFKGNWVYKPC